MVAKPVATIFSCPWLTANTSARQTAWRLPALITSLRQISFSPRAGASRLILYSLVTTSPTSEAAVDHKTDHRTVYVAVVLAEFRAAVQLQADLAWGEVKQFSAE
jgi:hypothetical protein